MYSTAEFRRGLKIEIDGKPYTIVEFQHVKPGKGGAFVRTKLKNLETGQVLEQTFRSGAKVDIPDLEENNVQYLYQDGDSYVFMDNDTYDQLFIAEEFLGDAINYLKANIEAKVLFFNGKPIGVDLPITVELEVAETEPGVKGDTATGASKNATMETGLVVQVPLFIEQGEMLKIDTRTGEYIERA
ncbi:MAG: elongation factor P [Proteobacteria bacterium]|nr:elongation factor P [Pseudomonadota bacterium]MBU4276090.1 elongation factor P [Pseudomonadota bacterium]MBU4384125.1 elongation factor P [Pseudomonadota bacterium]MBU4606651.1 elongation factor P [Pseudomonadota bacterium]MCG2763764.1 elongation factor P [Desulfarculaceae bacterium]